MQKALNVNPKGVKKMNKEESKKRAIDTADYQPRMLNEGYQPKDERVDPKTLILSKGGTAASNPRMFDSEKKK